MQELGAKPVAIFDRLRLEHKDFSGSLSAIKRMWRRLEVEHGPRAEAVAIPVETAPGQVAQVDFGDVGKLYDPASRVLRRAYVFVMVLGYSRHMFAQIVFDQSTETWMRLHVEAFDYFGGVPAVIVPDNLKAAVIRAAFAVDDKSVLNRSYRELARHHGFKIDPTPPYTPEHKGKVESAVKYVKHNFMRARDELDVGVLRRQLGEWLVEIAGKRTHGTTREAAQPWTDCCTTARSSSSTATPPATPHAGPESLTRHRRPTTQPDFPDALRRSVLPTSSDSLIGLDHRSELGLEKAISSADLEAISTPDP